MMPDHADRLMERRAPHFRAAGSAAAHPQVTTAGCLCGCAFAWIPADRHRAGTPRMMQSALQRYARPDRLLSLGHVNIQTCDRFTEKLGFGSAAGLEASGDLPRSTIPTTATTAAASWATSVPGDVASRSP